MPAGSIIEEDEEITAINVTPLVDITLVLLIIFMVTTTVITNQEGLGLEKPEAATGSKLEGSHILLVCLEDGTVLVDRKQLSGDQAIVEAVTDRLAEDRDMQGIVQCDKTAEVGQMVHLIDLLRDAGVKKYAIATKKPEGAEGQ